jgi:hypothetical protein
MRIRVINSKNEINTLDRNEEIVHLAFRPSNKDILDMVQSCPNLKAIHIPSSYEKTVSNSVYMLLEMKKITLLNGDGFGQKSNIIEYYEIRPRIFDKISELKNEGASNEKIISILSEETDFNKDLIKFLL